MATTTKSSKSEKADPRAKKAATSAHVSAPKAEEAQSLADLSGAYLAALEDKGTSLMTRASYQNDLKLALKALGEKTRVAALTALKVENFFESDVVTKTKTGKAKAQPTVLKTRRVLRLALVWAQEQGWIREAPIPEAYQRRQGRKKKAEDEPKKGSGKAKQAKASA